MAIIQIGKTELAVWERWLRSPFYFVKDCIVTVDESRAALGFESIRPFPISERYLRMSWIIMDTFPVTFWNKSRRMLYSWLCCVRMLQKALFMPNTANYVICYKFEDADYMLKYRIKTMYENIPTRKEIMLNGQKTIINPRALLPELKYKEGLIEFPETGAMIQAVSAGADQLRSRTASNVFWDEVAKQARIMETWAAIQPTIRGGGSVVGVSTPRQNAFKTLFNGIKAAKGKTFGFRMAA